MIFWGRDFVVSCRILIGKGGWRGRWWLCECVKWSRWVFLEITITVLIFSIVVILLLLLFCVSSFGFLLYCMIF